MMTTREEESCVYGGALKVTRCMLELDDQKLLVAPFAQEKGRLVYHTSISNCTTW